MKLVPITLLFVLFTRYHAHPHSADSYTDSLNRDLANLLNGDSAHALAENAQTAKARQLAKLEYGRLQAKYTKLKGKYEALLSLYKQQGLLAADAPTEHTAALDMSLLPRKHARRLVKLRKAALEHQRRMQDCTEHHHYYSENDFSESPDDSWLTSAVKNTANSLGIHTKSDALIAGAGAGALAYGLHTKKQNTSKKRRAALLIQKRYVIKESIAKMLTREVRDLTEVVEKIEEASRRVSSVEDNICQNITTQSMQLGED